MVHLSLETLPPFVLRPLDSILILLFDHYNNNNSIRNQVNQLRHPARVYDDLMKLIVRLAQHGLIHCDFNEFNLLINDNEEVTLIDFPQMVSTSHPNAEMSVYIRENKFPSRFYTTSYQIWINFITLHLERYFDRDVLCIRTFFSKKFGFETDYWPKFTVDVEKQRCLDVDVEASGFSKEEQREFEKVEWKKSDLDPNMSATI